MLFGMLCMVWLVVDIVFCVLLLPSIREYAMKDINQPRKRSIECKKRCWEIVLDALSIKLVKIIIFYALIQLLPDLWIEIFMKWYVGVFIVALFPVIIDWIINKTLKINSFWPYLLLILAITLGAVGYGTQNEHVVISEHREVFDIILAILACAFMETLSEVIEDNNKYKLGRISSSGIRMDMNNHTPRLMVNIPINELLRYCETYFSEYIYNFQRIRKGFSIEYVNLMGVHKQLWNDKIQPYIRVFFVLSTFIGMWKLKDNLLAAYILIMLLVIFSFIMFVYKHWYRDYLYKILIRYAYDEWGYYLSWGEKYKYVGTAQMFNRSRYHKYVHSFLDIVAFCRAVAFNDQIEKKRTICAISSNFCDLLVNYTDGVKVKEWEMFLPLWQSALFEYYIIKDINPKVRDVLRQMVSRNTRHNISIFLQSFWVDIIRKKLDDESMNVVYQFEREIFY